MVSAAGVSTTHDGAEGSTYKKNALGSARSWVRTTPSVGWLLQPDHGHNDADDAVWHSGKLARTHLHKVGREQWW